MLEGSRGRGGSYKSLVLAPEREKALKVFQSPPGVTETKANLSGFRHLVVHDDQLYSGMLQQSKKIKPEQFKRLQTAKWTYWEKFSLSLSPSHSLLVDLSSPGTAGALPAQHSPGTPCFPQQPPRQDILLKYWVMTWQAQQELVKGTPRYYQFHSLCLCLGLLLQPPGSAVPCSCTFTAKEIRTQAYLSNALLA